MDQQKNRRPIHQNPEKKEGLFLAIALILALLLRLIALDQSFWLDESVQVWASSSFSLRDLLLKYMPGDFNPPLYHLLLHFWLKIFPVSESGTRLLSVLLGTASLWLAFLIARTLRMEKEKQKLFLLLLATAPLHLYYSQEARMYILALFTFLLAFWRFLKFISRPEEKNLIFLSLSLILMAFSHFLTLLLLPFFFLGGMKMTRLPLKKRLIKWGMVFLPLLFFFSLYLPLFLRQWQTGITWKTIFPVWGKTVGSFTFKAVALLPVKFVIGRISPANKLLYFFLAAVFFLFYWLWPLWRLRKRTSFRSRLVVVLLLGTPLLALLISIWVPVFSYFRFLYLLPLFYLMVLLAFSWRKKEGKLIILSLLAVNLVSSGIYLFNPHFHRENWRGLVEWLAARNTNYGAPVLILSPVAKPFEYYNQGENQILYLDSSRPEKGIKLEKELWEKVYLVSYGLSIFDPEDKIREKLRKMGYREKRGESFRKVGVEEWGRE